MSEVAVRQSGIDFVWAKIDEIKPYEKNARRHSKAQIREIADSIAKFGFTAPIIVDADGVILAGHGRYFAALLLGLESVPVIRKSNLTEAEVRAYRILDNRLAEKSKWDQDLLQLEIQALKEEDHEIDELGFSDKELEKILEDEPEIDEDLDDDEPSNRGSVKAAKDEFLVVVTLQSESSQKALYERLIKEGLQCKLMS